MYQKKPPKCTKKPPIPPPPKRTRKPPRGGFLVHFRGFCGTFWGFFGTFRGGGGVLGTFCTKTGGFLVQSGKFFSIHRIHMGVNAPSGPTHLHWFKARGQSMGEDRRLTFPSLPHHRCVQWGLHKGYKRSNERTSNLASQDDEFTTAIKRMGTFRSNPTSFTV